MAEKKRIPKDKVTFIRKGGRVIPIRKKGGAESSGQSRNNRLRDSKSLRASAKSREFRGKRSKASARASTFVGGVFAAVSLLGKKRTGKFGIATSFLAAAGLGIGALNRKASGVLAKQSKSLKRDSRRVLRGKKAESKEGKKVLKFDKFYRSL